MYISSQANDVLNIPTTRNIFLRLVHLHALGIEHNDIREAPRNVVVDDKGEVYIIDLHMASTGHQCPGIKSCYELKDLAHELGLSY
jgi:predicted Ser/Thr protein kinase